MDQEKIQAFNEAKEQKDKEQADIQAARQNAKSVADSVKTSSLLGSKASTEVKQAVKVSGDKVVSEVAKVQSVLEAGQDSVAQAINNLMLATVLTKDPKLAEAAENVAKLLSSIADAGDKFGKSNLNLLPVANKELAQTITKLAESVKNKQDKDLSPEFDRVVEALNNLDIQPVVNIPNTSVAVDTKPITDAIKELQKSIKPTKIDIPKVDFKEVISGLKAVQNTISGLSFPVPNYILPFKDINGKAVQVQLDSSGNIPTSGSGGGDGAINDGVSSSIKATVFDYANSNPLGVVLRDTSGDYVSVGGGTQYTEDAAAAANPVGTAVNLIRKDTPAGETTTDGDNIAQRGTNYGAAYVTLLDSSGSAVSVGGGTQYDEDTASADAQKLTMSGVTRADTAASQVGADGDRSTLIVDASGRVHANVGVSALPTGAATSAKQDTAQTALDAIKTATETLDNAISGSEMQVDVVGALPAGNNNIGDVDVASSALPTGASTSAKQDTVIGHLDGVEGLLTDIESDTDTLAVVGGGTEATALRVTVANDSTGVVSVDDNGSSLTVDNAGLTELAAAINSSKIDVNIVSSDVATGGTSAADDADFTPGTTPGTPSMGVFESSPSSVTDGDLGTVGITAGRRLKTSATIDAALPAGTNAIGKLAANSGVDIGDVDVTSSVLPTGASTLAEQQTQTASLSVLDDWDETDRAKVNPIAGQAGVQGASGTVTALTQRVVLATDVALPAGTNGIGKLTANSGVDIGDVDVTTVGTITPGTAATSLGKAEDGAHTSGDVGVMDLGVRNDTMVDFSGADNDYTPKSVTAKGQVLTANAPRGRKLHQITTITASTSETTVLTAAASTFHDVYGVFVTNTSATATEVHFKDDTAGTTRFTLSVPANDMRGFALPMDAAIPASATNDNWTATCVDSVTSIIITVLAVKNL